MFGTKAAFKSVTVWGVILFTVGAAMNYLGIDVGEAQQVADQLEKIGVIVGALGLRRAIGTETQISITGKPNKEG